MNKRLFLRIWSGGVGGMDAVTGLLLVMHPQTVLKLLGITSPGPESLVFLSWIGVFVTAVGLSYGLAFGRRCRGETVWMFTALVRALVAAFLTFRMVDGSLPGQWFVVAAADAAVALAQVFMLRAGWWREVAE